MRAICTRYITVLLLAGSSQLASVCTPAPDSSNRYSANAIVGHAIEVVGQVSTRGNVPFEALVLVTSDRNEYVLKFEGEAPAFAYADNYRVSGELYSEEWNGARYAHILVDEVKSAGAE